MGTPAWIAADSKYGSEECLAYLQDKRIKTSINPETKSNRPKHFSKEEFTYDKEKDQYICPEVDILAKSDTHSGFQRTPNPETNGHHYCF